MSIPVPRWRINMLYKQVIKPFAASASEKCFDSFFILLLFLLRYLFVWKCFGGRKRQRNTGLPFTSSFPRWLPTARIGPGQGRTGPGQGQDWARAGPGARSMLLAIFCSFSQAINKEHDQKWSSDDMNRHPTRCQQCRRWLYWICNKASPLILKFIFWMPICWTWGK